MPDQTPLRAAPLERGVDEDVEDVVYPAHVSIDGTSVDEHGFLGHGVAGVRIDVAASASDDRISVLDAIDPGLIGAWST